MTAFIYRALELGKSIDVEIIVGKMRIHHLMGSRNSTKLSIGEAPVDKSLYEHYLSKVGFSKVEISSKTIIEKDIIYLIHQAKHLAELLDEVFTMEAIIFTPIDTQLAIGPRAFKTEMRINLVNDYMQLDVHEVVDPELLNMLNDELDSEYDIVNFLPRERESIGLICFIADNDLGNIKVVLDKEDYGVVTIHKKNYIPANVDRVGAFVNSGFVLMHSSYFVLHDGKLTTVLNKELVDALEGNVIVLVGECQSESNKYFTDILYGKFAKTLDACRNISIPLAILAGNNYWHDIIKF